MANLNIGEKKAHEIMHCEGDTLSRYDGLPKAIKHAVMYNHFQIAIEPLIENWESFLNSVLAKYPHWTPHKIAKIYADEMIKRNMRSRDKCYPPMTMFGVKQKELR